jgi:chemotaxis protein MotC
VRLLAATLALAALCASSPVAASEGPLRPYQMVRSLQLVQDRIAGGDHAALPMQRKLLEMIDQRLRAFEPGDMDDPRNFRAVLIYGMSGGNPVTLEILLSRLELDEDEAAIAKGVLAYLNGRLLEARNIFAALDIEAQQEEVAPFLALVKGSVIAGEDAQAAMLLLDRARLLAPGTLVEEAALRRKLALALDRTDAEAFLSVASAYVRRFLRSPYAAQFAEAFVGGIARFEDGLDMARVDDIVSWMSSEQAATVYLRLARIAAIEGRRDMLEFAASRAREHAGRMGHPTDARSALYAGIASVTGEEVADVLQKLQSIDAGELSQRDRALLDAASTVARGVVAPVPAPSRPAHRDAIAPPAAAETDDAAPDDADAFVTEARGTLDAIDDLLQEASQ